MRDGRGNGSDLAFAMAVTVQGDVVTVGRGIDQHGWGTAFAIAHDTSGLQKWVRSYQDPMWIGAVGIDLDDKGNVSAAGIVFGSDLSPEALALKCGVATTGIGNVTLK